MATIDKPLPNVSETVVEVPKQEELVQERDEFIEKKNQQGNIEVTMDEEGGAEIAFDPRAITEEGGQDHFENLADFLGEQVLEPLGAKMVDQYNEYIMTGLRTQWGVDSREIEKRFGPKFVDLFERQLEEHLKRRNLFWDGNAVKVSRQARFLVDGIASDLFLLHL